MSDTHEIVVTDEDTCISAEEGQTVLSALLENDINWMHACGMQCACTTCAIHVEEGGEHLSGMEEDEEATLKRFRGLTVLEEPVRLSCQATVHGDIEIRRPGWY